MEKVIKISKESEERFNHDKNVVGAVNRVPAPITNGADLQSDALCDNLFDEAEWVEHYEGRFGYQVLGFINNLPFKAVYHLRSNYMRLVLLVPKDSLLDNEIKELTHEIETRNEDEQCEPEVTFIDSDSLPLQWEVYLYYKPEYCEEYNS